MSVNRIWAFATAFAAVVILALGWFLGVQPLLSQASAADTQREGVEATNAAQAALVAQLRQKAENVEQYRAELAGLRAVSIPADPELPEFYALVESAAQAVDVQVLSITTADAQLYQPEGGVDPAALVGPLPQGRLAETLYMIPVSITLQATSAQTLSVASVLQSITTAAAQTDAQGNPGESVGRLVVLTSVESRPGDDPTGTIQAAIFVIHDDLVPASATEPAAPEPTAPEPTPSETPAP